ncbi:MAG: signal recognition particle receptor subunit alpha [Fervidicoccaceae archaeon]
MSEIFSGLREAVKKFVTGSTSYEKAVEAFIRDLQRELIRSDVNVKIVSDLSTKIKKRALEEKETVHHYVSWITRQWKDHNRGKNSLVLQKPKAKARSYRN